MAAPLKGLFVTGTDTGVGKTEVAAALARLLVERGVSVKVRKPVESGCPERADRLVPQDASRLCLAARSHEPLDVICPYPLKAAISPERAARIEGKAIALADLERACLASVADGDFLLVEGAGGLLSPLAHDGLVADLAARLHLPVLLVVADRLGCINHALLSAEALAARGLTLAAVVLNRVDATGPAGMDNAADLEKWLQRPVWRVPQHPSANEGRAALAALADRLARGGAGPAPLQSPPASPR